MMFAAAFLAAMAAAPAGAMAGDRIDVLRLAQSPSMERVRQAEAALERARRALRDAQENATANDWQQVGPARRVPKPDYAEHIARLEADVKRAEEALDKAKRDAL